MTPNPKRPSDPTDNTQEVIRSLKQSVDTFQEQIFATYCKSVEIHLIAIDTKLAVNNGNFASMMRELNNFKLWQARIEGAAWVTNRVWGLLGLAFGGVGVYALTKLWG